MTIVMALAPTAVTSATLVVAASIMPGPSPFIAAVVVPAPLTIIVAADGYSARPMRPEGSGACRWRARCQILTLLWR